MNEGRQSKTPAPSLRYDSAEVEAEKPAAQLSREQIQAVAEKYRIPLYEDSGVIEALARLDMSSVIPAELYGIIAEALAFVYRIDTAAAPVEKASQD